jgi:hypothetical protein
MMIYQSSLYNRYTDTLILNAVSIMFMELLLDYVVRNSYRKTLREVNHVNGFSMKQL